MTATELKERYCELHDLAIDSRDDDKMQALDDVTAQAVEWLIQNQPHAAANLIDKLEAIKWKNYLTENEARTIIQQMQPKAPWTMEQVKMVLQQQGLPVEEVPHYNVYALITEICKAASDHAETVKKMLAEQYTTEKALTAYYLLALDLLKDPDGKYDIRKYFDV